MKLKDLFENSKGDWFPSLDENGMLRPEVSNYNLDYISGNMICELLNIKSLVGSPIEVQKNCIIKLCQELTSLEGAPMIVHGNVEIEFCDKIKTLKGIGKKYFKEIHATFRMPRSITMNVLGLLTVKELKSINEWGVLANTDLDLACKIINHYLKTQDRDVLECQEEMIQRGLKEYAKL